MNSALRKRIIIGIACSLPVVALAQYLTPQPNRTSNFAERAEAKVVVVTPILESVVIGNNCQEVPGSAVSNRGEAIVKCVPVLQDKETGNHFIAEYRGNQVSGFTYRRLRVGDTVSVSVVTSITVNE